jgi:hypothetical protein
MKDINGYYRTRDNPSVRWPLAPQDGIYLYGMDIIELVLPKCKYVNCANNYLTKLIIQEGCISIDCGSNFLAELIVPKSCTIVYCYYNKLKYLYVPKTCGYVRCSDNLLPSLIMELFESDDPVKIELANNLQKKII